MKINYFDDAELIKHQAEKYNGQQNKTQPNKRVLHNIIGAAYSVYNIMLYPFLNYDKYFIETEKEELKKNVKIRCV